MPIASKIYLSTCDPNIKKLVEKRVMNNLVHQEVRLVPNRGRNFAPLLVEFRKELLREDNFIHVHSKKSSHSSISLQEQWGPRSYQLLLDLEKIQRMSEIFAVNENIGLIYASPAGLLRKINAYWGLNAKQFYTHSKLGVFHSLVRPKEYLHYPMGGMFYVRTSAIRQLLEIPWEYKDFPSEFGQFDGTPQHAIERLIGVLNFENGFEIAEYQAGTDKFAVRRRFDK